MAIPIAILSFAGVLILEISDTVSKSNHYLLCESPYEEVEDRLYEQVSRIKLIIIFEEQYYKSVLPHNGRGFIELCFCVLPGKI